MNGAGVLDVGKDSGTVERRVRYRRKRFKERRELREPARATVRLHKGWNTVLLKVVQPGGKRVCTYAVFGDSTDTANRIQTANPADTAGDESPLRDERFVPLLKWFQRPTDLIYDILPESESGRPAVGWYRFEAPPGMLSIKMHLEAKRADAWVNGEPTAVVEGRITLPSPMERISQVALRVEHKPGCYAGSVFAEPVAFACGTGQVPAGDLCDFALESYSGAVIYGKTAVLSGEQLSSKVLLDLGMVNSTAELRVNGGEAGIRMARPYTFDISELVREGDNTIEVKIHNTLANHHSIGYPTKYVYEGQTVSGLLGPVKLRFLSRIQLNCRLEKSDQEESGFGKPGSNKPGSDRPALSGI